VASAAACARHCTGAARSALAPGQHDSFKPGQHDSFKPGQHDSFKHVTAPCTSPLLASPLLARLLAAARIHTSRPALRLEPLHTDARAASFIHTEGLAAASSTASSTASGERCVCQRRSSVVALSPRLLRCYFRCFVSALPQLHFIWPLTSGPACPRRVSGPSLRRTDRRAAA
jgi:hypothetical protein